MRKIDASAYFSSNGNPKPANRFHHELCRTNSKMTSYSEVYKKRISMMNDKSRTSKLLNSSVERNGYIAKSREGSVQRLRYRTHNMDFQSNILNISIHSNNSNQEEEEIHKEEKYPDEDFIKVQDFMGGKEELESKEGLNQEYNRMIQEITKIQQDCEYEQTKIRTVEKNIKEKKKALANQKKPVVSKEGLSSLEYELSKQVQRLNQGIKKNFEASEKNTQKLKRELQGLREKYENLNDKDKYLVDLRRDEELKQTELQKQMAAFQKLKKQQTALLSQLGNFKEEQRRLQDKLNMYKNTELPNLDTHKKYMQMLQRSFMEHQIGKINSYLTSKRQQAQSKKKAAELKQKLSQVKEQLGQLKKELKEKTKRKQELQAEAVKRSQKLMSLKGEESELEAKRASR